MLSIQFHWAERLDAWLQIQAKTFQICAEEFGEKTKQHIIIDEVQTSEVSESLTCLIQM